jgi:hypothetical protein
MRPSQWCLPCVAGCSAQSLVPGRRPWSVGAILVGRRASGSGAGRKPWSRGRHGGRRAACGGSGWTAPSVCVLCRRRGEFAEGKPLPTRATTATSADAVPFLKALLRLLPVLLHAPGESPRSSDRAVAALSCRDLLEDTALESTLCGSPLVVWLRRGIRRARCSG